MGSQERRSGLSAEKQEEMYDMVKDTHTHLFGHKGSTGKLRQFEDKDDKLERMVGENTKSILGIKKIIWKAIGAGIIVSPLVTSLIIFGIKEIVV